MKRGKEIEYDEIWVEPKVVEIKQGKRMKKRWKDDDYSSDSIEDSSYTSVITKNEFIVKGNENRREYYKRKEYSYKNGVLHGMQLIRSSENDTSQIETFVNGKKMGFVITMIKGCFIKKLSLKMIV